MLKTIAHYIANLFRRGKPPAAPTTTTTTTAVIAPDPEPVTCLSCARFRTVRKRNGIREIVACRTCGTPRAT